MMRRKINANSPLHGGHPILVQGKPEMDWFELPVMHLMFLYRVTMVVVHLGWVDSDLGSSPGRWAVTAAICCPTGGWNILNLSQPNPGARPPWSPCTYRPRGKFVHPAQSNGPRFHVFPRDPGECPVQGPQKLSEELEQSEEFRGQILRSEDLHLSQRSRGET